MADYSELIPLGNKKPFIQLMVSLLVLLTIAVSGLIITVLTAWLIFGIAPGEINTTLLTMESGYVGYLKYLQTFQHLTMFMVPSLAIAYFMSGDFTSFLGLKSRPSFSFVLLCIIFIILIIPLNSYFSYLNAGLELPGFLDGLENWIRLKEARAERLTSLLIEAPNIRVLFVNILVLAIIPAIGEEFFYRGILQRILGGWLKSGMLAVVLTAIIFSAAHLQFYGFLPRLVLGLGFGFIYLWSRNIWLAVLAHLTNNIIPVVLSYFWGWQNINTSIDDFSSGDGLISLVPALFAVLILVVIWRLNTDKD